MALVPLLDSGSARDLRWRKAALNLSRIDGAFLQATIGIGRLDCALRLSDGKVFGFTNTATTGTPAEVLSDYFCLANLWVFGAYEIVRTLNQRVNHVEAVSNDIREVVRRLRDNLSRVRVPIAKFEVPRQHPTDRCDPRRMLGNPSKGWGWVVGEGQWVYRNDLADEMLTVLDLFRDANVSIGGS